MFSSISVSSSDVHLSYLPLAHIAERGTFINVMFNGAKLGIFSGSKKLLASDMAMLQPTLFVGVPRIYNLFYTKIEEGMKKAKGVKAWLLKKAIATKLHNL
jgi:long-chain acyl-CoA synthetase